MSDNANVKKTSKKGKGASAPATPPFAPAGPISGESSETAVPAVPTTTVVGSSTTTVVAPTTVGVQQASDDKGIFSLAAQIEAILSGQSNKTCQKVLNMVGSLHGIRVISADRPIGQSAVQGVATATKPEKKEKGEKSLPAPYKSTEAYKSLQTSRTAKVQKIKACSDETAKAVLVTQLRDLEQQLKALKGSSAGDQ